MSGTSFFAFQEWEEISGFVHAFSGRDPEPVSSCSESCAAHTPYKTELLKTLNLHAEQLFTLKQIHSEQLLIVDHSQASQHPFPVLGSADGIILANPGRFGVIRTADCIPIVAVVPKQKAVCLLHAGWRGTCKGICRKGIQKLQETVACSGQDIQAALGPCIRRCCYQVGPELEEKFRWAGHPVDALFRKDRLDLVAANRIQLEQMGVGKILDSHFCTACRTDLFYSYRREKTTQRMWTLAGFRNGL